MSKHHRRNSPEAVKELRMLHHKVKNNDKISDLRRRMGKIQIAAVPMSQLYKEAGRELSKIKPVKYLSPNVEDAYGKNIIISPSKFLQVSSGTGGNKIQHDLSDAHSNPNHSGTIFTVKDKDWDAPLDENKNRPLVNQMKTDKNVNVRGDELGGVEMYKRKIRRGDPIGIPNFSISSSKKEIIGHEGRHRARALKEEGIKKIPVNIVAYSGSRANELGIGLKNRTRTKLQGIKPQKDSGSGEKDTRAPIFGRYSQLKQRLALIEPTVKQKLAKPIIQETGEGINFRYVKPKQPLEGRTYGFHKVPFHPSNAILIRPNNPEHQMPLVRHFRKIQNRDIARLTHGSVQSTLKHSDLGGVESPFGGALKHHTTISNPIGKELKKGDILMRRVGGDPTKPGYGQVGDTFYIDKDSPKGELFKYESKRPTSGSAYSLGRKPSYAKLKMKLALIEPLILKKKKPKIIRKIEVKEGMIQTAKTLSADAIADRLSSFIRDNPNWHRLNGTFNPVDNEILDANIPFHAMKLQRLYGVGNGKIAFNSITDTRKNPVIDIDIIRSQLREIEQSGGTPAVGMFNGSLEATKVLSPTSDQEALDDLLEHQRSTAILDPNTELRILDNLKFREN